MERGGGAVVQICRAKRQKKDTASRLELRHTAPVTCELHNPVKKHKKWETRSSLPQFRCTRRSCSQVKTIPKMCWGVFFK